MSSLIGLLNNAAVSARVLNGTSQRSSLEFRLKLEKHLDDVKKSKGYLDSEMPSEINMRAYSSAQALTPKLSLTYGAYLSTLNYAQLARMITGIYEATANLKGIV
jgi:hypothetical protein